MSTDPPSEQKNRHVGEGGEIPLPDAVSLIDPEHAGRVLRWANEQAMQAQNLLIGFYAIFVEWYVSIAALFRKFPYIGLAFAVILITVLEENFSDQPVLTNTVRYFMYKSDPDAAEMIFAAKAPERDPIGKASRRAVDGAVKSWEASGEYQDLQREIEEVVALRAKRDAYLAAGMREEAAAVESQMVASRATRTASLRAEAEEAEPVEPEPVAQPVVEPEPVTEPAAVEPEAAEEGGGAPGTEPEAVEPEEEPTTKRRKLSPEERARRALERALKPAPAP